MENTSSVIINSQLTTNAVFSPELYSIDLGCIDLEQYEGPIDLLLHLVKREELPIEKLSLAKVADQYLSCLSQLAELDFDLAGEYLVIAATLVSIKSSYLIDGGKEDDYSHLIESPELDPHAELLRRLREAAVYREGAEMLSVLPQLGIDVFPSMPTKASAVSSIVLKDHDPFSLGRALQKLVDKAREKGQEIKITVDAVNIADRMIKILGNLKDLNKLKPNEKVSFETLIGEELTVLNVVASFLAILELCKRNIVSVGQNTWCEGIDVWLTGEIDESVNLEFNDVDSDISDSDISDCDEASLTKAVG